MEITDFRNGNNVQVKVNNKWYNLITFSDGKFGIKRSNINKVFNSYFEFDEIETKKINEYLNK